jgi:hypothetical protein
LRLDTGFDDHLLMRRSVIMALLLAWPAALSATLGGDASTVDADRVRGKAALLAVRGQTAYIVHELQAPTGTVIREYVSPAGRVYGVAWQGPWMPDLRQLLGTYFDQYLAAMAKAQASPHRRRGSVDIETPEFVVHAGGRPRAFVGSAYVPALMPLNVAPETVR